MSISDLQIDTSSEATSNSQIPNITELARLRTRAPFDELQHLISKVSSMSDSQFALHGGALGAELLNNLGEVGKLHHTPDLSIKRRLPFIDQDSIAILLDNKSHKPERLDYEAFIYQKELIPTRRNWHDFYNGLIWLQFAQTKRYFNAQHYQQIQQFGLKKRSPIRDRLTHFDECGLVLVTDQSTLIEEIAEHKWHQVFVNRKSQWHKQIKPIIFGHALWEMLMQPFIGLTAKVTVINDAYLVKEIENCTTVPTEQSSIIDAYLLEHMQKSQLLEKPKPWLPLPLLGIPNWSHLPQTPEFYANASYFMPKRH